MRARRRIGIRTTGATSGAFVLTGIWAGVLGGCAGTPTPPELAPVARLATDAQSGLTGEEVYLRQPDGGAIFRTDGGERLRRRVAASEHGWTVTLSTLPTSGGSASDDEAPVRTVELERGADGGLAMRTLTDHAGVGPARSRRGSRIGFEPALALLPAVLSEDAFESHAAATLHLGTRARGERGDATRSARLLALERIELPTRRPDGSPGPARAVEARVLEGELDLRFGPTRVQRSERLWVHDELGIVAESAAVRVTFAGVRVDDRRELSRLELPHPSDD